jgi:hypothetical protein
MGSVYEVSYCDNVPSYPLVPKSTRRLTPGDFWSVPFATGRFGCGRVLQVKGDHLVSPTRAFFGCLHDWAGDHPPTWSDLKGSGVVACGLMHVKAITETGGTVLGNRTLELDRLEVPLLLSAHGGPGTLLLRGVCTVRPASRDDLGRFPVLGVWGHVFIRQLAAAKLH